MSESMYDRLGELLNESLESGEIKFVKHSEIPENKASMSLGEEKTEKIHPSGTEKKGRKIHFGSLGATGTIYKCVRELTPSQKRAFRLLGVSENDPREKIKKSYRSKLLKFHPDRYQNNDVLRNIAVKKTREIVDAYREIMELLESS